MNRPGSKAFGGGGAFVAVTALAVLLAGCSAQKYLTNLFGGTSASVPPPQGQPTVYYASVEGVKLYAEPRFSSAVVARLRRHQKVYRYGIERGFARVTVEGSGAEGWVDNNQLTWRTPQTSASPDERQTTPAPQQPVAVEQPSTPDVPVESPPTEEAPQPAAAPATPPTAPAAAAEPQPAPTGTPTVNPALFDPF